MSVVYFTDRDLGLQIDVGYERRRRSPLAGRLGPEAKIAPLMADSGSVPEDGRLRRFGDLR